jgi:hypothetical protein
MFLHGNSLNDHILCKYNDTFTDLNERTDVVISFVCEIKNTMGWLCSKHRRDEKCT